jgi:hypothetical protein
MKPRETGVKIVDVQAEVRNGSEALPFEQACPVSDSQLLKRAVLHVAFPQSYGCHIIPVIQPQSAETNGTTRGSSSYSGMLCANIIDGIMLRVT